LSVKKHRQLARQVGAFANNRQASSMASVKLPDGTSTIPARQAFVFGSWVCVSMGGGDFNYYIHEKT